MRFDANTRIALAVEDRGQGTHAEGLQAVVSAPPAIRSANRLVDVFALGVVLAAIRNPLADEINVTPEAFGNGCGARENAQSARVELDASNSFRAAGQRSLASSPVPWSNCVPGGGRRRTMDTSRCRRASPAPLPTPANSPVPPPAPRSTASWRTAAFPVETTALAVPSPTWNQRCRATRTAGYQRNSTLRT